MRVPNEVLLPMVVELLGKGHSVTLPLRGHSMRPFIEDSRDKAVLESVDIESMRRGDVVLALLPMGTYVIHRIIKVSGNNVTLLGDGNLMPEHCTRSDILAKVTGFYRKGRAKVCSTSSVKWRVYSWSWMVLRPLRRWLLTFHRRVVLPFSKK